MLMFTNSQCINYVLLNVIILDYAYIFNAYGLSCRVRNDELYPVIIHSRPPLLIFDD